MIATSLLLRKEHTKVLLQWLARARACGGAYDPFNDGRRGGAYFFSVEEIKAELATREHIPNKQEARKIRQDKAKAKRNR